jgi:hypothetical protein
VNHSNLTILEKYLQKQSISPPFIKSKPNINTHLVIVIPCYNEPDLLETLESIEKCIIPQKGVEVIIVLNSSENTEKEIVETNKRTKVEVKKWKNKKHYSYHTILLENIPKKVAGVGYARKIGMDEAIHRFLQTKTENGIICSLDADSKVAHNYLIEIEKLFGNNNECNGCSIYFEHAIDGNEFENEIYRRIAEYEIHLRYYKSTLKYVDFPHHHYTVGSSFAVRAKAYCLQGGMNKRQAGEDFYFLQKIMSMGNYFELNTTTVFPSSRTSNRVPFGTGPIINQYLQSPEKAFLTYNFTAFTPLKQLFADKQLFFKARNNKIDEILKDYHPGLREFLSFNNFKDAIATINNNIAHQKNFERKFFHWFDGFRVIKYLNFVHDSFFEKQEITKALQCLYLKNQDADIKKLNNVSLLKKMRAEEKR